MGKDDTKKDQVAAKDDAKKDTAPPKEKKEAAPKKETVAAAPKKTESGGVSKKKKVVVPDEASFNKVTEYIKEFNAALKIIGKVDATAKIEDLSAEEQEAFDFVYVFEAGTEAPGKHTRKDRIAAHKLMGTKESQSTIEKIAAL